MRSFRNDRKGQFIVLAAIIIAAFMFSLVLTISQMSLNRQELSYEPIDEIVLAITSDFERCLTKALAEATLKYSENQSYVDAKNAGEEFIRDWFMAVSESYKALGINIILAGDSAGTNVDWIFDWDEWNGISYVYTTFSMDINAYGLSGLALTMQKRVYLNILDAKVELSGCEESGVTITFKVMHGGKEAGELEPIQDLTCSDLSLLIYSPLKDTSSIIDLNLEYMGQGVYMLKFKYGGQVMNRITLMVTASGGIRVAADLNLCTISLASRDLTRGDQNEGCFTVNGTECYPPYFFSLFPRQTANVSFSPPENSTFSYFCISGPLEPIQIDGSNLIMSVTGGGLGNITACYRSFISPEQPPEQPAEEKCYIRLYSQEEGGSTENLGKIELNGQNYTLPSGEIEVPYNQTLQIKYYPDSGFIFKYWKFSEQIIAANPSSQSTEIRVLKNGTITAVYGRPKDWQVIYISPEKSGKGKNEDDFVLTLNPGKEKEIQPISYGQMSRRGDSENTTPSLPLGKIVEIILYARASSRDVHLNVTLGFYTEAGYSRIGSNVTVISKSNNHLLYTITFEPEVQLIPEGSTLVLILERTNTDPGEGTLHILCGSEKSRIKLW
ncbi:MAG: hypothetical protein QXN40_08350 [Candidatus Bathyarchaeia archaeon]